MAPATQLSVSGAADAEEGECHQRLIFATTMAEGVECEKESGVAQPDAASLLQVRHGARMAKLMSTAALVLSVFSALTLAVLAPRLFNQAAQMRPQHVMGLSAEVAAPSSAAAAAHSEGWYHTRLNREVTTGSEPASGRVATLPAGSLVYVTDVQGQRARLTQPALGWMSLKDDTGIDALRPDTGFVGEYNEDGLAQAATGLHESQKIEEAKAKLKASAARLTAARNKMMESLQRVQHADLVHELQQKSAEVGKVVHSKAPHAGHVGQAVARGAGAAIKHAVDQKEAKNLLHGVAHEAQQLGNHFKMLR